MAVTLGRAFFAGPPAIHTDYIEAEQHAGKSWLSSWAPTMGCRGAEEVAAILMTGDELTTQQLEAALRAINPPNDRDVRNCLAEQDYLAFYEALGGAVGAYLNGGRGCLLGDWQLDPRMLRYKFIVAPIELAKQAEIQRMQALVESEQFVNEAHAALRTLEEEVARETKPPPFAYPPALTKYDPSSWCDLDAPTTEQVTNWATPHILKKVPPILGDFVSWKLTVKALALPRAVYVVCGVPCLAWGFTISILVRVHLELAGKIVTRTFCGYEYRLVLGTGAIGDLFLGPVGWRSRKGFTTPIALLPVLARGDVEGEGIQVMKNDRSSITFLVPGYDGEVTVSTLFRQFLMSACAGKDLAGGLHGAAIIDDLTAQILERKMGSASLVAPARASADGSTDDSLQLETALATMGYSAAEIKAMMARVHLLPGMSAEDRVRAILEAGQ